MSEKLKNDADIIYALIGNIPLDFHTPDLRNFFSYSIEKEFFVCFNYRHRPHQTGKFNTCICKVKANRFDELVKLYDKKNWIDTRGRINKLKCSIVKVKVNKTTSDEACSSKDSNSESLTESDLNSLLEFARIPNWMRQGNVGTPTRTFVEYINQCAMPQSLIAKLGVNLSTFKKHKKKAYSNVEYKYETGNKDNEVEEEEGESSSVSHVDVASTANGHRIVEELDDESVIREKNYSMLEKKTKTEKGEEEEGEDDDGDELEDWERHESLHDDVTKQDRTSPYFFEHEIELKWEKGGSGLVFYTDDNFWKEQENKDFDAETADDLDVDTSVYYDANGSDKDARDMLDMRRMDMMRAGADTDLFDDLKLKTHKKLNPFNRKPTNPNPNPSEFGRKQLEKMGWKEGEPVGTTSRQSALTEPLDASDGKHPMDKSGIGYRGDKIDRQAMIDAQKRRREREHRSAPYFIGSKYDEDLSRPDTLLRRIEPNMKYRSNNQSDTNTN